MIFIKNNKIILGGFFDSEERPIDFSNIEIEVKIFEINEIKNKYILSKTTQSGVNIKGEDNNEIEVDFSGSEEDFFKNANAYNIEIIFSNFRF